LILICEREKRLSIALVVTGMLPNESRIPINPQTRGGERGPVLSTTARSFAAFFRRNGEFRKAIRTYAAALTNAANPTSRFRVTNVALSGANIELTYTSVVGRHYSFEYGSDLVGWTPIGANIAGSGGLITTPLAPGERVPKIPHPRDRRPVTG
jgi:hypothetical protein